MHVELALAGAEIITNGSGSHHVLRKANTRFELVKNATSKCGGIYVFSNQRGCDGGRLYFDGCSSICANGALLAQGSQFGVGDVEVLLATVDLADVRSCRGSATSLQVQSANLVRSYKFKEIDLAGFQMCSDDLIPPSRPIQPRYHSPEEECAYGPACWLWDYMRRSGARGFLLPLSGGADSAAVAAIVFIMCNLVTDQACSLLSDFPDLTVQQVMRQLNDEQDNSVIEDLFRICPECLQLCLDASSDSSKKCDAVAALSNSVLHTIYMGTVNSSNMTSNRAQRVATCITSFHSNVAIDAFVSGALSVFSACTGLVPRFESRGGFLREDLALQNLQARCRMVVSYLFAQLLPWVRGVKSLPGVEVVPKDTWGYLLVLSSGNVDEALRGYMTKYDCSSGDINPIGGINKGDLKRLLLWVSEKYSLPVLKEIALAAPSVSVC
jgi:NAD+ synthase (glutamine-hydrolysing)